MGGEGGGRGWDGWVASLIHWTWVWVNSGNWWWTGRPGVLQSTGSQRVGHYWATELTEIARTKPELSELLDWSIKDRSFKEWKENIRATVSPIIGILKCLLREFLSGPVVSTRRFQCYCPGFKPWLAHSMCKKIKTLLKEEEKKKAKFNLRAKEWIGISLRSGG